MRGAKVVAVIGDITNAAEKAGRFPERDTWLNLGGWRVKHLMPGEVLYDGLKENA